MSGDYGAWLEEEMKQEIARAALEARGITKSLPGYPDIQDVQITETMVIVIASNGQRFEAKISMLPDEVREKIEDGKEEE